MCPSFKCEVIEVKTCKLFGQSDKATALGYSKGEGGFLR